MQNFNEKYIQLKNFFCPTGANVNPNENIKNIVHQHGYLPIPFSLAQIELSNDDIFECLEIIFKQEKDETGEVAEENPVKRTGYSDSSWLYQEQLKIETLCLSGLKNNGELFRNYLLKIITTSKGNRNFGIPATVFYILPPYKRDGAFSSVYCPSSIEIDPFLQDEKMYAALKWDAEEQVQFFFALCRRCGHPILLDLLPQAGRFSKTVFAYPQCFLWHNVVLLQEKLLHRVKELIAQYGFSEEVFDIFFYQITNTVNQNDSGIEPFVAAYNQEKHALLKKIKFEPNGDKGISPPELKKLLQDNLHKFSESDSVLYKEFLEIDFMLDQEREKCMLEQCTVEQKSILAKVMEKIVDVVGCKVTNESDIDDMQHQRLISEFMNEGLWTLPGGCWNSSGYPIFRQMQESNGNTFPVYEHYNYKNNIVSGFAGDMDIVTPWYFALPHLAQEKSNLQQNTISTYIEYCKKIYTRFYPNGFRLDHLDHSADYPVSVNKDGNSISYRAPLSVFKKLQEEISLSDATFILLAEYMGWGDDTSPHLYKEYSDNNICAGISLDIVGEYRHNAKVMIAETNNKLEDFNKDKGKQVFTLAHILDNHDRSHPDILRALSEFTKERALLKWVKCIFLPGGKLAQRPTVYLDGNQTHTPNKNFAKIFLGMNSLERENDIDFYIKFDALYRNSLTSETLRYGYSKLLFSEAADENSNNMISAWLVVNEKNNHDAFLVVANEYIDDNTTPTLNPTTFSIPVPLPYWPIAEWILPDTQKVTHNNFQILDIIEIPITESKSIEGVYDENKDQTSLAISDLKHNEFRIYRMFAEENIDNH